ncbi:MAG: ABC-type lipoprotein release transport system permease subunit, partial [Myxococcota bacterium]
SGGGGEGFSMQGMQFDPVIKGVVRPIGVVATLACVFVVSVLAAFWPALRAARLRPVEAMRQV